MSEKEYATRENEGIRWTAWERWARIEPYLFAALISAVAIFLLDHYLPS